MGSITTHINNILDNKRNVTILFCLALLFLCIVKLPTLFTTDIQPWDEGMYALRVLSIHVNGDLIDQSSNSVGGFYSGSHPPLLIWIGYMFSLVFGLNAVTLKLIIFAFAIGCLLLIYKLGERVFDAKAGLLAVLIFSSTIIFNVFSKRFQFDIPYSFFILLSVYLFFLYNDTRKKKYLWLTGVMFGLCLMIKILVGIFIPLLILASFFFIKKKVGYTQKDVMLLSIIGILIAAPWHIYMISFHGQDFLGYFLGFHIFDRAFSGLEHNTKGSGVFYHINYLFNIIPFSILIFYSMFLDIRKFRTLPWEKIFLWGWFLTGLIIISFFRTKLEVYILLILAPGVLLLADFIFRHEYRSVKEKITVMLLLIFNFVWYFTDTKRDMIRLYIYESDKLIMLLILLASFIFILAFAYLISKKINYKSFLIVYVFGFFIVSNVNFLINVPAWENTYQISEVKKLIEHSSAKKIIYVVSEYRHNPQLSFYFNGADMGWKGNEFEIELTDLKNGIEQASDRLQQIGDDEIVLVEKDNINRSFYPESKLFITPQLELIYKTSGYELYRKVK